MVTDLVDGTILVELVQALTGERLFGTVPSPRSKEDAVTNIQVKLLLRIFRVFILGGNDLGVAFILMSVHTIFGQITSDKVVSS